MTRMHPLSMALLCAAQLLFAGTTWAGTGEMAGSPENDAATASQECLRHRARVHDATSVEAQQEAMRKELLAYQSLAEEALAMRAIAIQVRADLHEKLQHNETLSGQDLLMLNRGAEAMLNRRDALLRVSVAHECWLNDPIPDDPRLAAIQATGIGMSLSAALLLYDNYLSAISLYRSDTTLRRLVNRADKGFEYREGQLNQIALSFASPSNRYRVRRGIQWFEKNAPDALNSEDDGFRYLAQLVDQSPARQIVKRVDPVNFVGRLAGFFTTIGFDTLLELKDQGVFVPSLLFGNAVGLVESRHGKLYDDPAVVQNLSGRLHAGDILLEKTPFRLTDSFIPGHWGHAAIWVGTPDELRALGIWDHPIVRKYHEQIEGGKGVVEALRSGVQMNSLAHFMNIDDLAALREPTISEGDRAQVVIQALRQVGKAYDFNFDVESSDKIVCSELIYHTYSHLKWPTAKMLGRATISPDNVAVRSLPGDVLDVEVLYHDGKEIVNQPLSGPMAELLRNSGTVRAEGKKMVTGAVANGRAKSL